MNGEKTLDEGLKSLLIQDWINAEELIYNFNDQKWVAKPIDPDESIDLIEKHINSKDFDPEVYREQQKFLNFAENYQCINDVSGLMENIVGFDEETPKTVFGEDGVVMNSLKPIFGNYTPQVAASFLAGATLLSFAAPTSLSGAPLDFQEMANANLFTVSGVLVDQIGNPIPDADLDYIRNGINQTNSNTSEDGSFEVKVKDAYVGLKENKTNNFGLSQNYPNPFNHSTKMNINVSNNSKLEIYSLDNKLVAQELFNSPGSYIVEFNSGSGIFIASLKNKNNQAVQSIKMVSTGNSDNSELKIISHESSYQSLSSTSLSISSTLYKNTPTEDISSDTLVFSGSGISKLNYGVDHFNQDINLGNIVTNVGPRVSGELSEQSIDKGEQLNLFLENYIQIYNDGDENIFVPRNVNFSVTNGFLKYSESVSDSTWIDIIDGTDPNLKDSTFVKVNVNSDPGSNQAPSLTYQNLTGSEDVPFSGPSLFLTYTDDSTSADSAVFEVYSKNGNVSVSIDDLGIPSFKPDTNWYGIDSVVWSVTDQGGLKGTYTSKITFNPVNDRPVVVGHLNDKIVFKDETFQINVPYHYDVDNDTLQYYMLGLNGAWDVSVDNKVFTITPPPGFLGTMSGVHIRIDDGQYLTPTNTAKISVVNAYEPFERITPQNDVSGLEGQVSGFDWYTGKFKLNDAPSINVTGMIGLDTIATYSVVGDSVFMETFDKNTEGSFNLGIITSDGALNDTSYFNWNIANVIDSVKFVRSISSLVIQEDSSAYISKDDYEISNIDGNPLFFAVGGDHPSWYELVGDSVKVTPSPNYSGTSNAYLAVIDLVTNISDTAFLEIIVNPTYDPFERVVDQEDVNGVEGKISGFNWYTGKFELNDATSISISSMLGLDTLASYSVVGDSIFMETFDKNTEGSFNIGIITSDDTKADTNYFNWNIANIIDSVKFIQAYDPIILNEEDSTSIPNLSSNVLNIEGGNLNFSIEGITWWNYTNDSILFKPPKDYFGPNNVSLIVNNGETSDTMNLDVIVNNIDDPTVFNGPDISNKSMDQGSYLDINLANRFSDPDNNINYSLKQGGEIVDETWWNMINDSIMRFNPPSDTSGIIAGLYVKGTGGATSDSSNLFNVDIANIYSNVTFIFKDATQDTIFNNNQGNLSWTGSESGSATTNNGIINISLRKGDYDFSATYANSIDGMMGLEYTFFKRNGDLEAFEQRARDDQNSVINISADNDTINVYKLHSDFPISWMIAYASNNDGGINVGTRKFSTNDNNAKAWWDGNYDASTGQQRQWFNELKSDLTSVPHVYLNLPFEESSTQPSNAHLRMAVDNSFPAPGTNGTIYDSNHNISLADAQYPPAHSEYTFKIEIFQGIGDLNDVGGDPAILNPGTYTLNTTGKNIFSVMYLAKPKTKF